jgi:hypothetical protein
MVANALALGIQPPAHAEIFICQNNPRTRAPRRQRGHQPRRPRPDHQQVAMQEALVIASGSGRVVMLPSPAARRIIGSYSFSQKAAGHMKVL